MEKESKVDWGGRVGNGLNRFFKKQRKTTTLLKVKFIKYLL